jgi:hypothetical protein
MGVLHILYGKGTAELTKLGLPPWKIEGGTMSGLSGYEKLQPGTMQGYLPVGDKNYPVVGRPFEQPVSTTSGLGDIVPLGTLNPSPGIDWNRALGKGKKKGLSYKRA